MVHLSADVVDVVVDHGEGHNDGENSDDREGHGRVGHEFVGPHAAVRLHFVQGWFGPERGGLD